jgi:hypothetical protein
LSGEAHGCIDGPEASVIASAFDDFKVEAVFDEVRVQVEKLT